MSAKPVCLKTEWTDPITGTKGYLVIDELIDGLCGGGIRMRPGLDVGEVESLARVMTAKFMAMGIPCGGAKGGIDFDPAQPDSREVLRRYLLAHRPFLKECWGTSEDLGTREEEILAILQELGVNTSVHAVLSRRTEEEQKTLLGNLLAGLFLEYDGMAFTDVTTGYGVAVAAREALRRMGVAPERSKAAIQGFGTVGGGTALYLCKQGVRIVAVADREGTVLCESGLDVEGLLKVRDERGLIDRRRLPRSYRLCAQEAWLAQEVDLLVPAAISGAIAEREADRIRARLVVEGANLPTTEEAERKLAAKGVKVVPDFIANSGGIGLFGALLFHHLPPEPARILDFLDKTISGSIHRIFDLSEQEAISLREAADRMVEERRRKILGEGPR